MVFKNVYVGTLYKIINPKKHETKKILDELAEFRHMIGRKRKLKFVLEDHVAIPCPRPRVSGRGKFQTIYTPGVKKHRKVIQTMMKKQLPEDFQIVDKEIRVKLDYYLPPIARNKKSTWDPTPEGYVKKFGRVKSLLAEMKILRPGKKPDIDNLDKTYFDAMNDFIWSDDDNVIDSHSRKFYSLWPRVEIIVEWRE